MRIAIQGQKGSFHDEATARLFPNTQYEILSCDTFRQVFEGVDSGKADLGVVAIENSLYGSLHETYDQLVKYNFSITGELSLQIHQNLIANQNSNSSQITEVLSHPAALDQCRNYLKINMPSAKLIEHADTAGAVADIANSQSLHQAAIASGHSALLYDMKILAKNIEDEENNTTRFITIKKQAVPNQKANKASLIIITDHTPGALYKSLGVFYVNNCNLTKLESRPIRNQPFQYQFIVDILASRDQLISAMHELEQIGTATTLLGHYRSA